MTRPRIELRSIYIYIVTLVELPVIIKLLRKDHFFSHFKMIIRPYLCQAPSHVINQSMLAVGVS